VPTRAVAQFRPLVRSPQHYQTQRRLSPRRRPASLPWCPTCPSVTTFAIDKLQRLTCPRQHPNLGVRRLDWRRYPAGYTTISAEEPSLHSRFPVAFRPPALASWASCARPELSLPYGRPTLPHAQGPNGVSTFRTNEIRPGRASSLLRDGGAHTADRNSPAATCRFPTASPLPRYYPSISEAADDEAFEDSLTFTRPVFPSPVVPGWNRNPWASPSSFEPRRYQRRTLRWGQAIEH
jgi:hypothetical protein